MSRELEGPWKVGDLLDEVGARSGMHGAKDAGVIWRNWRTTVGDAIADHAEPSSLRDGVLRVRVDSPSWATELSYLRDEIVRKTNEMLGRKVVNEVRVWTGPAPAKTRAQAARPQPEGRPREVPRDPFAALQRAVDAWARWRKKGA